MDDMRRFYTTGAPKTEYRILASSQGEKYVMDEIYGEVELYNCIGLVQAKYPQDTLYVRVVNESVIMVIAPDGTVTKFTDTHGH
jgi:hypothetical protein